MGIFEWLYRQNDLSIVFLGGKTYFSFRMDTLREGTPGRGKRIDKGKGNLNTKQLLV